MLFKDLRQLGDVLSERELQIFKEDIMGDQVINSENLKNALLGYKWYRVIVVFITIYSIIISGLIVQLVCCVYWVSLRVAW